MRISKNVYGFIIIGVLLGGLIITKMFGLWEIYDRGNTSNKHAMSIEQIVLSEMTFKAFLL